MAQRVRIADRFAYGKFESNQSHFVVVRGCNYEVGLFHIKDGKVSIPLADDTISALFAYRSKRADEFTEQSAIEKLMAAIKAGSGYKGINHIGFHYKVVSKEDEVKRITQAAISKGYHAYQEPSSDDAAWVFVGDISEITNPLLEFLPHNGKTNDKWVDYYPTYPV